MQQKDTDPPISDFFQKCKAHNLKITPQRMAIYLQLLHSTDHPTVNSMFRIVKNEFPNISGDTVSRTMLTFAEIGIVNRVEVYGGAKRFDSNLTDHHHLHCVDCGNIIDFQNDEYDNLAIPDEVRRHFKVLASRVVFKGICNQCGNSGKASLNPIISTATEKEKSHE